MIKTCPECYGEKKIEVMTGRTIYSYAAIEPEIKIVTCPLCLGEGEIDDD